MNDTTTTAPRIYVACLAAYNGGRLHGRWIDATQDAEDIYAEVREMLAASPEPGAEEWAIHDYEGFATYSLSEYTSFETVSEIAQGIEEHGEAFAAYLSTGMSENGEDFEDRYAGTWDSEKDYAYDYVDQCGWAGMEQIPDELESYLDWDQITRDLMMDYTTVKLSDYTVAIFRDSV